MPPNCVDECMRRTKLTCPRGREVNEESLRKICTSHCESDATERARNLLPDWVPIFDCKNYLRPLQVPVPQPQRLYRSIYDNVGRPVEVCVPDFQALPNGWYESPDGYQKDLEPHQFLEIENEPGLKISPWEIGVYVILGVAFAAAVVATDGAALAFAF